MVVEIFAVSYFGIAALAVLWKYSKLPDIDWGQITAGAMLLFVGAALPVLSQALATFVDASAIFDPLTAVVTLVGALFVVIGGLKNALHNMKK